MHEDLKKAKYEALYYHKDDTIVSHVPMKNHLYGLTTEMFRKLYDSGEVELSTVFENLYVKVAKSVGKKVKKISEAQRDFDNNGDFKREINGRKNRRI